MPSLAHIELKSKSRGSVFYDIMVIGSSRAEVTILKRQTSSWRLSLYITPRGEPK